MFGVFQKTCKSCKYYHHFKEDPKPSPDKTIPDNLIEMHWCEKGDFELLDLKRCPAYVNAAYTGYVVGFKGIEEFNRRRAALGRYILIKPPKGESAVPPKPPKPKFQGVVQHDTESQEQKETFVARPYRSPDSHR